MTALNGRVRCVRLGAAVGIQVKFSCLSQDVMLMEILAEQVFQKEAHCCGVTQAAHKEHKASTAESTGAWSSTQTRPQAGRDSPCVRPCGPAARTIFNLQLKPWQKSTITCMGPFAVTPGLMGLWADRQGHPQEQQKPTSPVPTVPPPLPRAVSLPSEWGQPAPGTGKEGTILETSVKAGLSELSLFC